MPVRVSPQTMHTGGIDTGQCTLNAVRHLNTIGPRWTTRGWGAGTGELWLCTSCLLTPNTISRQPWFESSELGNQNNSFFPFEVFLSEQHKSLPQLLTTPAIQPQKWSLIGEIKVSVLAEIFSKQEIKITTQAYSVLLRACVVPAKDLSPIFVNYTLCKTEWGWITTVKLQENPSSSSKNASSQVLYFSQASSKQLMLRYWSTEPTLKGTGQENDKALVPELVLLKDTLC